MPTYAQVLSEIDLQGNMDFYDSLKSLWEAMTLNEARRGEDPLAMAVFVRDNIDKWIDYLEKEALLTNEGHIVLPAD